jgi:hypothetical protein
MFGRSRLRRQIKRVFRTLKLNDDAIYLFDGGMSLAAKEMKRRKLDPARGVVLLISDTLVRGATNGALAAAKRDLPSLYQEMKILWLFCSECAQKDYERFGKAWVVGELKGNPFDEVE